MQYCFSLVKVDQFLYHCCSRLQEKHTREKLRDHLKMITGLQSELAEVQGRVAEARRNIQEAHERQKRMLAIATR